MTEPMKSKVIRLADPDQFIIDPEYKESSVNPDEIQAQLETMASNLGQTVTLETPEENCGVVCRTLEGQTILLYPSLGIPGAEQACADIAGKIVGDTVATTIRGVAVTITIEQFLANRALPLDDQLALASEIDGVQTLDQLRGYLTTQELAKKKEEKTRQLVMAYVQYMMDNSEVFIDEAEVDAWVGPMAKQVFEEELSFGIDLRFTEDGEMISEEEALARLAEDLRPQFTASLIQHSFGEAMGFVPPEEPEVMGDPYDMFMYETFTVRAKEALA